jgi:hypothetical protein
MGLVPNECCDANKLHSKNTMEITQLNNKNAIKFELVYY